MRIESPENFIKYLRSECSSLYSSLSKGVHSELVMDSAIIYDKSTVIDLIYRTFKMCSTLGMVSHYIDLSICTLDKNTAFEYYRKIYDWSEEDMALLSMDKIKHRFFVRLHAADKDKAADIFDVKEEISAQVSGEYAFITGSMTEKSIADAETKVNVINRIRIEQ